MQQDLSFQHFWFGAWIPAKNKIESGMQLPYKLDGWTVDMRPNAGDKRYHIVYRLETPQEKIRRETEEAQ